MILSEEFGMLMTDQKEHRDHMYRELNEQCENDPNVISQIITGDETWV